jgi:mRNA-degrading endonuclease RelE of RelBE toxin-antitoxin system
MSQYRLDVRDKAKQQVKLVLPDSLRTEIVQAMLDLRDDPKPPNSELQRELQGRYRLKINGWRVFYKIDDAAKVVTILEVRPRNRNTYLNVP